MSFMIWSWLILSYLSLFILGFSDNLRGPLFYEIINHFQITDTQGALFFSTSSMLGFGSSLLAIPLLKKTSYLRLLQWALFLMAFSLLGLSQAPKYWMFLVSAGLLGTSMGFMGVTQNALASTATPERFRSQALSGLHSMYGLASFLAPLCVGLGLVRGWKWNEYFILASILAVLIAVMSFFLPKPNAALVSEVKTAAGPFRRKRLALWISGMTGLYVIAEILVGTRLSLYSIREYGLTTAEASGHVTTFYLGLLSGRLAGIFIRWPSSYRNQLVFSIVVSCLGYVLGLYVHPWFFSVTGLGMSIFFPTSIAYASQYFRGSEGVIFSLITATQSILIVSMHLLVGVVSDLINLKVAFHLGLVFLAACAFCLWRFEVEKTK